MAMQVSRSSSGTLLNKLSATLLGFFETSLQRRDMLFLLPSLVFKTALVSLISALQFLNPPPLAFILLSQAVELLIPLLHHVFLCFPAATAVIPLVNATE